MLRAFHPARRRRHAAASVEFALASLVFFTLIIGLVDFGRALMTSYGLVNAARRAARVAVVPGRSNTNVTAAVTDALGRGGIPSAYATTTVKVNGTTADVSTARPGDRITVTIAIPVNHVTWLPMTRWVTGTVSGTYTLCRE